MSILGADSNQERVIEHDIRLHELPNDILFHICMNMNLFEINIVRQICHYFNQFGRSSILLNALSYQELQQIILHYSHHQDLKGEEIEEIMNMTWGKSFFETYKLTWEEHVRELSRLLSNPRLQDADINHIQNFLDRFEHVSPEHFIEINDFIVNCNLKLSTDGTKIHYTDVDQYGFNYSNLGLTRFPVQQLMRIMDITQPLISLDLSHNYIKNLPRALEKCLDLWSVKLNDNEIETIPEYFSKFTELEYFQINANRISDTSPKVRQLIKRACSESWHDLLSSQKHKQEEKRTFILNFIKQMVLPYLLIHDYCREHKEEFDSYMLNQLVLEGLILILLCSSFHYIFCHFIPTTYNSFNMPYKQDLTDYLSNSSNDSISNNSEVAKSYELGRQSQRSWVTYFNSFSNPRAYSRAYYAGYTDERHDLPSRIQGQEKNFESKARRLLFKVD